MMATTEQRDTAVDGFPAARDLTSPFAQLTPTQVKVLQGVHSGLLNKQIAFDLGIAETTVKAHMTALMRKLNVRNRTQVAIAAQTMGWGRNAVAQ
jgi:DNA-binding NarL/FixJ family response regulator